MRFDNNGHNLEAQIRSVKFVSWFNTCRIEQMTQLDHHAWKQRRERRIHYLLLLSVEDLYVSFSWVLTQ